MDKKFTKIGQKCGQKIKSGWKLGEKWTGSGQKRTKRDQKVEKMWKKGE